MANFQKQLNFITAIATSFTISDEFSRFSVVAFSDNARVVFNLEKYQTMLSLKKAIENISYNKGGTNVGAGINTARTKVFTSANGDRADAANYMIILTDGNSEYTIEAGQTALAEGITIIAIGIDGYNLNDLIGATGDKNKVFTLPSYATIDTLLPDVLGVFPCRYSYGR